MFKAESYEGTQRQNYDLAARQLEALVEGEPNRIANLANASALLGQFLQQINWVGFYMLDGNELVLGPFQGLPACVRIPLGKGVCGTAAKERKTLSVPDVHRFPGHIACDAASQSEIVIPFYDREGGLLGVLDIDSPVKNRFDEGDRDGLEQLMSVLSRHL